MLALTFCAALFAGAAPPPNLPVNDPIFADLDDDDFDVREAAQRRLGGYTRLGCEYAVRHHLKKNKSLEVKSRLARFTRRWEKEDWLAAETKFDTMFPRPEDVPEIDGAWYDPADCRYRYCEDFPAYKTLSPWLSASPYDEKRFGGVGWVKYRTATRWWGITMLFRGEDADKVKEAVLWIKARDDVFLTNCRGGQLSEITHRQSLKKQRPPDLLLKKTYPSLIE